MNKIAVLTGDIVNSQKFTKNDNQVLLDSIKAIFVEIANERGIELPFEMWRGDSFQVIVEKPELAMEIAVLFRAGLRWKTQGDEKKNGLWDARIGIGVGDISFRATTVASSNGEAFILSGSAFDLIDKSRYGLNVLTSWNEVNSEMGVSTVLADVIISSWSKKQSEAIYQYMLFNRNQTDLAQQLDITQPALQKRLNENGNYYRLELFLKRYKLLVEKYAY